MPIDLGGLWDVLDKLLGAGNSYVEAQVETTYGIIHAKLKENVEKTTTEFDDHSLVIVELGLRDKLIKLYPLETYPLD